MCSVMKQHDNFKMDGKKTKRRKNSSASGKRHGRAEENPKSAEVMDEKEKQDRLEAASVLSSLMFFPPKSSGDETVGSVDLVTPSASMTQFSVQQTIGGIPPTSQTTSLVQGASVLPSTGAGTVTDNTVNMKNRFILEQLQNQLNQALKTRNVQPFFNVIPITQTAVPVETRTTLPLKNKDGKTNSNNSQNVPLTVHPQNLTINRNVAMALRQVVSSNRLKPAESATGANPSKEDGSNSSEKADDMVQSVDLSQKANAASSNGLSRLSSHLSPAEDEEKMDCESLPSTRRAGNTDTNLPLKKRRLIGVVDNALSTADLTLTSAELSSLGTLNSTRQIENILQMAKDYPTSPAKPTISLNLVSAVSQTKSQPDEGYRPVQVDPRTSLMMLSDLKFALVPDEDGDLPIHIAVVHENTELVKRFIDIMGISGKTVDRFNKLQQTPLHLAVLVNQPEIISILLAAGANPNLLDRHGYTSVHITVNKQLPGCMDTVFRNSQHSININTRDYEGYYPLHTCVEQDNLDMMMSLVERGADIDCQDGKAGRSALLYAIEYNRATIVQYLLDQEANAELRNYAGITPMMTAQAANMEEIVQYLNKALDIGNKYEESYIPSKKLPMPRIPSKSSQIINRDSKTGRVISSDGIRPLIYEEFKAEQTSEIDSTEIKQEPLSRQSSVSSPIDLSMRSHSESSQRPPPELPLRGRPRKRKVEKELKNHKEKWPQKSKVKENHASVVAALERTMSVNKKVWTKASAEQRVDEASVKVEKEDKNYEGKKQKVECNEDNNSMNTFYSKLSSEAVNNLLRGIGPIQTKQLLEKVREQFSVHLRKDNSGDSPSDKTSKTPHVSELDTVEKQRKTLVDEMQVDIDTTSEKNSSKKKTETENHADTVKLKDVNTFEENRSIPNKEYSAMVEGSEEVENESDITDEKESTETVKQVQSVSSSQSSEESNRIESDNGDIEGEEENDDDDEIELNAGEKQTGFTGGTSLQNMNQGDASLDKASENVSETHANRNGGAVDGINAMEDMTDIETPKIHRIESDYLTNHGKTLANGQFASQISQDSNSGNSLHGSQGFEVISAGVEISSSPIVKLDKISSKVDRDSDHSDSSMEIEFSNTDVYKGRTNSTITAVPEPLNNVEKKIENEGEGSEHMNNEILSKASLDTDEDEDEKSLVIDEHVSDDETLKQPGRIEKNDTFNAKLPETESVKLDTGQVDKCDKRQSVSDILLKHVKGADMDSEGIENLNNSDGDNKYTKNNELELPILGKTLTVKQTSQQNSESKTNRKKDTTFENASCLETSSTLVTTQEPADVEDNLKQKQPRSNNDEEGLYLKQGQSHTLFYHDGDGYKPVKIFIDNSEQSSLVLQKMFQTTQLSNLKKPVGIAATGSREVNTPPQKTLSETKNSVEANVADSTSKVNLSTTVAPMKTKISQNDKASTLSDKLPVIDKTSSNVNIETSQVSVASAALSAGLSLSSNPLETKNDFISFQQAYIESLKVQSMETKATDKSTEKTKKRTPASVTKKSVIVAKAEDVTLTKVPSLIKVPSLTKVPKIQSEPKPVDIASFPGENIQFMLNKHLNIVKSKSSPEGTLTRVNPDIRNKLSKALQSPQRKVALNRSDTDASVVNSKRVLGNSLGSLPGTITTSISESRQQS